MRECVTWYPPSVGVDDFDEFLTLILRDQVTSSPKEHMFSLFAPQFAAGSILLPRHVLLTYIK